jgi:hypothetical protein
MGFGSTRSLNSSSKKIEAAAEQMNKGEYIHGSNPACRG